jgi:hypothetical protein
MPDNIKSFPAPCQGGLLRNLDYLTQGNVAPGSAIRMINYEPSLEGGYRRISGYTNTYGTVPGATETPTLGVAVFAGVNDGIFACKKPTSGNNYLYRWNNATSAWVAITSVGSPTMTGVTKVRFTKINWGVPKLVLTDGVNPAATWDGTTYVQITSSTAPAAPKFSENFASHLFLAGNPTALQNLYFSAPLNENSFSPADGAGVINVGFEIRAIKAFRDQLYIFGRNNIKRLVGTNIANFSVVEVTKNLGCVSSDAVIEFNGDLLFLAPDGIRPVSATDRIGDIELGTLSKPIQPIFEAYAKGEDFNLITLVTVNRKSQFRLFFANSESLGLIGSIRQSAESRTGFEYSQLIGVEVNCADSGYIGTEEFVIHGDSLGRVHRQEVGQDFNGTPIFSLYQTPYLYMDDPILRKIYYDLNVYMKAEGQVKVLVGIDFDYGSSYILKPSDYSLTTEGAAAYWGEATYDATDIYDGNPSPIRKTNIQGSGDSISLTFVTVDDQPSHTIQAFVVSYTLADRR